MIYTTFDDIISNILDICVLIVLAIVIGLAVTGLVSLLYQCYKRFIKRKLMLKKLIGLHISANDCYVGKIEAFDKERSTYMMLINSPEVSVSSVFNLSWQEIEELVEKRQTKITVRLLGGENSDFKLRIL